MERPQNITVSASSQTRTRIAVAVIILFHLVGIAGFFIPILRPFFLQIVPYHLLLMLLVIVFSHQPVNARFFVFMLMIWVLGFMAEWVGIHKAWIFGNYVYGEVLGIKINDVPLIMGINWFLLIYSTGVLMQRARIKNSGIRIITGALLLVLLDMLIEPTAIRFNYWHWVNDRVPVKNYVGWFMASGLLLFIFEKFEFKKQSIVGPALLIAQFIFFGVLIFLP